MNKKYITIRTQNILFVLISSFFLLAGYYFYENKEIFERKMVHSNLYDLTLPSSNELTFTQKFKRLFYREYIWHKIKHNSTLMELLDNINIIYKNPPKEITKKFPKLKKIGFRNLTNSEKEKFIHFIQSDSDQEIKELFFTAKQIWSYISYSTPLGYELSGVERKKDKKIKKIEYNIRKSDLILEEENISHKNGEVDYIIIGSGPAGSIIAHELAKVKKNLKIILLDSGSFPYPNTIKTELKSELMESLNLRRNSTKGIVIRNANVVGGGTTVNLDLAFSPLLFEVKSKLSNWINNFGLKPDLLHGEKEWENLKKNYEYISKKLNTREVEKYEVNKNNNILLQGHKNAKTYSLNAKKPSNNKDEILKISSIETFIFPALNQEITNDNFNSNINLISDVKVEEIIFSKDKNNNKIASFIKLRKLPHLNKPYIISNPSNLSLEDGKEYIIKAKNIVLSAGALGTSEILLKSKIKNDNIGKGIVIHPSMPIIGIFDNIIDSHKGLSASVYASSENKKYIFESMSAGHDYIAMIHPGIGKQITESIKKYRNMGGFGIMLIDEVTNTNMLELDENGKIIIHYNLSENDKNKMREGLIEGAKILFKQGAKEIFIPTHEMIYKDNIFKPFEKEDEIQNINKLTFKEPFNFISSAHMQGSNKLGTSKKNSVISPNFRLWNDENEKEIENLYICDSSIFPTSVGANPMQSIYTICKIFADEILLKQ